MRGQNRRGGFRRKVCRFCVDPEIKIDYKETAVLIPFLTDRGKIIPRRISGNCSLHQREVSRAIKTSRHIALLPYVHSMGE